MSNLLFSVLQIGTFQVTVHTMTDHPADQSWASTVMEPEHMPHRRRRFQTDICGYVHTSYVNSNGRSACLGI